MRVLQAIFAFYVQGSIHVSLALVALLAYAEALVEGRVPGSYYALVFFGSIAGYNVLKATVTSGTKPRAGIRLRGGVAGLTVLAALLAVYFLFAIPLPYLAPLGFVFVFTVLYALPLYPGMKSLRGLGWFKILWVALVWTLLTLWIPFAADLSGTWDFRVEAFQRLLLVSLLMVPFEVRDMAVDPPDLLTLPRKFGLPATRALGVAGAFVFLLLTALKDVPTGAEWMSKGFMAFWVALAIYRSGPENGRYFASFWVETIPIGGYLTWVAWSSFAG
ncbi:hypothetical protein [Robiginitalea sediminis]|uniref:hypothetical protein n=1 Tax=Robiginitalea sediminis TaxID=1982593 RepID=UPI000B4B9AD6|nr:hypothetical protein [Robiginitalea sediminis]